MIYNIDFALAGLLILLILYVLILKSYNQTMKTIIVLRKLVFLLILADTFDIITAITISFPYSIPIWLNYLLNVLFFEFEVICISVLPKYINAIIDDSKDSMLEKINNVLVVVYAVICASTPLTKALFYFDANRVYTHGPLYMIVFAIPFYYLLCSSAKMYKYKSAFKNKQFFSINAFVWVSISGPILQALIPGNVIIDFFALSIAAFLAIIGLETPDFLKLESALIELEKNEKLLEKAKKREEERNKVIHEMTKSASWSIQIDEDHNILDSFWSDEFFWMLGYEKSEIAEQTSLWAESLHPDDSEFSIKSFMDGLYNGENYDITYRLKNKKGEYKWYRGTGELKINQNEKISIFHGIIQDINDEKIKEDLAKEKISALEKLEKSQADLEEAVRLAQAADKAKSDFLANMSHEIRTPINAVLGMNELISRESTEKQILEYSSNVADAGNALLSLINDILDFSKIEAGRMELAPDNYELSILLREVNNIMNIRFIKKGIDFRIKNNPNLPNNLYGDEVRIRQILINILNNALKYTDKGSVTLDVNFEKNDSDSITLILSSIDTGIGIKEEDLPSLFKSFTRIDLHHNRKKEGTGLGLSITQSFVELMGGTIDVESTYGQGSTFKIRIPQKVVSDEVMGTFDASASTSKKANNGERFTAPDARILVVDDIEMNLEIIKGLLKPCQLNIDLAESGQACLDAVAQNAYDIILLDHMMPDLDGVETMKLMKNDTTHPNQDTPVIMLTANAIIGAREEYLALGFSDYLSKPIQPNELDEMIVKYLPAEKVH